MRDYMKFLIGALLAFALVAPASALTVTSGTVTVTVTGAYTGRALPDELKVVAYSWTSDASGQVTATLSEIEGEIVRLVVNPADGASSPTANYDAVCNDVDGNDILGGQGANLSQSANLNTTLHVTNGTLPLAIVVYGNHTLLITNAGNTQSGLIRFYVRP